MRFRRSAFAALIAACLVGATTAPAVAAEQPRAASKTTASVAFAQTMANPADVEFVEMMIPHHFQALVMSRMAPTRASNQLVRNLAERIMTETSGREGGEAGQLSSYIIDAPNTNKPVHISAWDKLLVYLAERYPEAAAVIGDPTKVVVATKVQREGVAHVKHTTKENSIFH